MAMKTQHPDAVYHTAEADKSVVTTLTHALLKTASTTKQTASTTKQTALTTKQPINTS